MRKINWTLIAVIVLCVYLFLPVVKDWIEQTSNEITMESQGYTYIKGMGWGR